jgi:pSer/pThr/pTyr-binding forkhead associated (FHA) protein
MGMKLVIEDEAGTRSVVPFVDEAIVVGRGSDGVTFRLPERNVSRRHARFLLQAGSVSVEDLGSLTGTWVNGERIVTRRRLRDGDLVQIGEYDLAVLAEEAVLHPGAPPPLPATPRPTRPAVAPAEPAAATSDPNAITARLPLTPAAPPRPAAAPPSAAPGAAQVPGALRALLRWLKG